MSEYYTVLTEIGQAKLANATALGQTLQLTAMAVGDGGGATPAPDPSASALVGEQRRAPLNQVSTDPDNPNYIVCEQVIPEDVGGWWIREIGIFDDAGDLIAYGNFPPSYKPVLAEGSGRTQTIRAVLMVSDTAAITLKIDPSVVLATREYADREIAEHAAAGEAHNDTQITLSQELQQVPAAANVAEALTGLGGYVDQKTASLKSEIGSQLDTTDRATGQTYQLVIVDGALGLKAVQEAS